MLHLATLLLLAVAERSSLHSVTSSPSTLVTGAKVTTDGILPAISSTLIILLATPVTTSRSTSSQETSFICIHATFLRYRTIWPPAANESQAELAFCPRSALP